MQWSFNRLNILPISIYLQLTKEKNCNVYNKYISLLMFQLLRSKNFFPSVRLHFLTERKQMYIFFKIMAHDKYCFFFSAQNLHSWFVERTISEMMHTSIALDWLQINLNFSWTSCKAVLKGTGCFPNGSKINILL